MKRLDTLQSFLFVDICRASKVVRVIDMGISGVSGVVFGGPRRDILFVIASKNVYNSMTFKPMQTGAGGSLYKVTGLCAKGFAPTRFKMPDVFPN